MRATADTALLEVSPGTSAPLVVEVVNTGAVIDGVSARVIGLPIEAFTSEPALLPLFPDASGNLTLSLNVPMTHSAGRHPLTIEITSHGAKADPTFVDFEVDVAAVPSFRIGAKPRVMQGRRSGRTELELVNDGNVPLNVSLNATDVDRSTSCRFAPERLRLDPGIVATSLLTVRGPRMLSGNEFERSVNVVATAERLDLDRDSIAPEDPNLVHDTNVRLKQRPYVSRGLQTALILVCIIALWAGVFLLGLSRIFATDPLTKQAPASFFLSAPADSLAQSQVAVGDTVPKAGLLPPGVGAAITGTVTSASAREPVGRILVQAIRISPRGQVIVSSAATQADGTFTLAGLFPQNYYLKFSAKGFRTIWYPKAPSLQGGAKLVPTAAQGTTTGADVVITGLPASISGSVDLGDTTTPLPTTVTARRLGGTTGAVLAGRATTNAAGAYTLPNLPAPATYELSFTAPGYQATTIIDTVSGGDTRLEPVVVLGTSSGQLTGIASDGRAPLGGVTVTTTVRGKPVTVVTPTVGRVGVYVIGDLPTPATYVVTFAAPGHGTHTIIVDLAAGQSRLGLDAVLVSGTGSVSGRVVDSSGNGLGSAKITLGGSAANGTGVAPSTTTLTAGDVGGFVVNGLIAPGSYTLTATLPGFAPTTIPFTLSSNGPPATVTITLDTRLGSIRGRVIECTNTPDCAGATVTVTNGTKVWTTTVSSPGGALPEGGYLVNGLEQGTYTVTVTLAGHQQNTALVTVTAGQTATQDLNLGL